MVGLLRTDTLVTLTIDMTEIRSCTRHKQLQDRACLASAINVTVNNVTQKASTGPTPMNDHAKVLLSGTGDGGFARSIH